MSDKAGGDLVLKIVLAACIGVIITGTGAWLAFGGDKVTTADLAAHQTHATRRWDKLEKELRDYVRDQGPWMKARGEVQANIRNNSESIGTLATTTRDLVKHIQQLTVEQAKLLVKFDAYLDSKKDGG